MQNQRIGFERKRLVQRKIGREYCSMIIFTLMSKHWNHFTFELELHPTEGNLIVTPYVDHVPLSDHLFPEVLEERSKQEGDYPKRAFKDACATDLGINIKNIPFADNRSFLVGMPPLEMYCAWTGNEFIHQREYPEELRSREYQMYRNEKERLLLICTCGESMCASVTGILNWEEGSLHIPNKDKSKEVTYYFNSYGQLVEFQKLEEWAFTIYKSRYLDL